MKALSKWIIPKYVKGHGVSKKWMIFSAVMLVLQSGLIILGGAAWYDYALVVLWVVFLIADYRQYVQHVKLFDNSTDIEVGIVVGTDEGGWAKDIIMADPEVKVEWSNKWGSLRVPGHASYSTFNNWMDAVRTVSLKVAEEMRLREEQRLELQKRKELHMFLEIFDHGGHRIHKQGKMCAPEDSVDVIFPEFMTWFNDPRGLAWDTGTLLIPHSAIGKVSYSKMEVYREPA